MEKFEKLLTYDEAAEILGVGYTAVSKLCCRGEIDVVRLSTNRRRIEPQALRDFIERKKFFSSVSREVSRPGRETTIRRRLLHYTPKPMKAVTGGGLKYG